MKNNCTIARLGDFGDYFKESEKLGLAFWMTKMRAKIASTLQISQSRSD